MTDILTQNDLSGHYTQLGIGSLTSQEETYVLHRTRGINPTAAARSAGYTKPAIAVADLSERADVQRAIAYFREMSRQSALAAGAMEFSKDDATALYLEAHAKSACAMEEIRAVDSLVKLHGLATPEKVEVKVTRVDQLESMDDEQLLKLAGKEIELDPSQYTELNNES